MCLPVMGKGGHGRSHPLCPQCTELLLFLLKINKERVLVEKAKVWGSNYCLSFIIRVSEVSNIPEIYTKYQIVNTYRYKKVTLFFFFTIATSGQKEKPTQCA